MSWLTLSCHGQLLSKHFCQEWLKKVDGDSLKQAIEEKDN